MNDIFGLQGKKALVVGGGQGMGERSAHYLAMAGADVAIADIDESRANQVADSVRALGRKSAAIVGNVLDDSQTAGIVDAARAQLGGLDRLVTIVGQATFQPALEFTPAQWDLDHQRNLRYVFFLAQAFAKGLIAE